MNVNPKTHFQLIPSDERSFYDYYGVHYLDYLHINLLYCGGTAVIRICVLLLLMCNVQKEYKCIPERLCVKLTRVWEWPCIHYKDVVTIRIATRMKWLPHWMYIVCWTLVSLPKCGPEHLWSLLHRRQNGRGGGVGGRLGVKKMKQLQYFKLAGYFAQQ